jgi:hypothetical protein
MRRGTISPVRVAMTKDFIVLEPSVHSTSGKPQSSFLLFIINAALE